MDIRKIAIESAEKYHQFATEKKNPSLNILCEKSHLKTQSPLSTSFLP